MLDKRGNFEPPYVGSYMNRIFQTRANRFSSVAVFEVLLAVALFIEIGIFSKTGVNFATTGNFLEVLRLSTEIGLLALVMTPVILTGGIDL
jgi:rhamnose transport system permease protein